MNSSASQEPQAAAHFAGWKVASGVVWPIDPARSSCQYRAIAPGQRRSDMGHH